MDYEKKYNEALERARNLMAMYPQDAPGYKEVFPELRESEDERIRKFLKDYAIEMIAGLESDISISVYDGVNGHDPDAEEELEKWREARAWLEKQKEPTTEELYAEAGTTENEYIANTMKTVRAMREKQKEQKPAEWSEEDEVHRKWILECLADGKRKVPEFADQYKSAFDWLKSIRHSWKPSEEQPEADLEKASRNVYESWMGGTMDDVRRDMVELGKVLNARKED